MTITEKNKIISNIFIFTHVLYNKIQWFNPTLFLTFAMTTMATKFVPPISFHTLSHFSSVTVPLSYSHEDKCVMLRWIRMRYLHIIIIGFAI